MNVSCMEKFGQKKIPVLIPIPCMFSRTIHLSRKSTSDRDSLDIENSFRTVPSPSRMQAKSRSTRATIFSPPNSSCSGCWRTRRRGDYNSL
ncbi:hypothetical protein MLD38_021082 [Melastoma candidum]|uniref:Uncharacterized protein n=1 Tax=Melastoma candidum TaxID=119954 RepID=A0ACB9QHW6_9MYRT|nr:hypothetical protein MLD38_021082 [Melastoma candidum]